MDWRSIGLIIFSYLLGCINTGYYYTRLHFKKDIRSIGTNVTGAMNVSRMAGKKGFIITFLGDALKGVIIVLLCRYVSLNENATLLCILMVIVGHILPFQLSFRGGKGMSTMFGAFLTYNPLIILFAAITCLILFPFIRKYTITSLFALSLLPFELLIAGYGWRVVAYILASTLIILFACRSNLKDYIYAKDRKN